MKPAFACALILTMGVLWLLASATISSTKDKLAIRIMPSIVSPGGDLRLTCRVPRDARNRWLEYGIVDYAPGSFRQLDGEQARITWETLIPKIPCGSGPAYCAVHRNDQSSDLVSADFLVVGCEP